MLAHGKCNSALGINIRNGLKLNYKLPTQDIRIIANINRDGVSSDRASPQKSEKSYQLLLQDVHICQVSQKVSSVPQFF